jgi:predicted small lipoprotein YifL
MMRLTIMLIVLTVAGFVLTGCGKRGALQQPDDVTPTYPRTYPSK